MAWGDDDNDDDEDDCEEEEEEGSDDEEDFENEITQSQRNELRETNARAMRDGTLKIQYGAVLKNLKPPERDEVILRRPFRPVCAQGIVQSGTQTFVFLSFYSPVEEKRFQFLETWKRFRCPHIYILPFLRLSYYPRARALAYFTLNK